MAALGPPIWQSGVWATTVWQTGVWLTNAIGYGLRTLRRLRRGFSVAIGRGGRRR